MKLSRVYILKSDFLVLLLSLSSCVIQGNLVVFSEFSHPQTLLRTPMSQDYIRPEHASTCRVLHQVLDSENILHGLGPIAFLNIQNGQGEHGHVFTL